MVHVIFNDKHGIVPFDGRDIINIGPLRGEHHQVTHGKINRWMDEGEKKKK